MWELRIDFSGDNYIATMAIERHSFLRLQIKKKIEIFPLHPENTPFPPNQGPPHQGRVRGKLERSLFATAL